jgi:tRNA pseudouridine55 synthase
MSEILLFDKPKGITSFELIRRLRCKYQTKKIGHAGTLDPLATGLMVIGVGPGTKKLHELVGLPKEYLAEIRIGERRTTGDMEGEILERVEVTHIDQTSVQAALTSMNGILRLPVSAYSAMKKGGVPFYKRARRAEKTGERIVVPLRDMEVLSTELLSVVCEKNHCVATVRFEVGSGTYIRSLGEELGKRLGYPATLQNLRRTKVGSFNVDDAIRIEK